MESADRRVDVSAQLWTKRAEGRHPSKVDFCSEQRNWVQRAMLEAEKNEDSDLKDQLLSFLRYFEVDQECFLKREQQGKWEGKL